MRSLIILILLVAPPVVAQEIRCLTTPYARAGENMPLIVEFDQAPSAFTMKLGDSLSYTTTTSSMRHEIAAFVASSVNTVKTVTHGQSSSHSLPARIVPRDKSHKLIGVFSHSPVESSSLLGEKIPHAQSGVSSYLAFPKAYDFPGHWSMLTAFDAIAISRPEDIQLSEQQLEALAGYMVSGGSVLVFGNTLFEGSSPRANFYLRLGEAVTSIQQEGVTLALYRVGAGSLLHARHDLEGARDPRKIFESALDQAGIGLATPSLSIDQPSSLASRGYDLDFVRSSASQHKHGSQLLLGIMLGSFALAFLVSLSLRKPFKALGLIFATLSASTLSVVALTTDRDSTASHHRVLLCGPNHHAALSTSIISTDPLGKTLTFTLEDNTWATPAIVSHSEFSFERSHGQWQVHLSPGSAVRFDRTVFPLPFTMPETPLVELKGGQAQSNAFEGERFYRDFATSLDIDRATQTQLNDWLEGHVWKNRSWKLWLTEDWNPTLDPLSDAPEPTLGHSLVAEYAIQ